MTAQQLRNSILQQAIQGRLVPQDPNDEPASVVIDKSLYKGKISILQEEEYPVEIPSNWCFCRLQDVAITIGGYAFKSDELKGNIGTRVIRISDVTPSGFSNKNIVRYNNNLLLEQYEVHEDDILIAMTGGTVGKSLYVDNLPERLLLNQRVAIVRAENIYPLYLDLVIKSPLTQDIVSERKNSTNDNISMVDIKGFIIPLPPLAEQRRIVAKIEELMPLVEKYGKAQTELDTLNQDLPRRLRQSVLQQAIQGKLVEQDPNDEPASVLLERIRKEKEQLVQEGKLKKKDLATTPIADGEIPFDIPSGWEWCRLGDLGVFERGNGIKKDETCINGYPCVRYGEMYTKYRHNATFDKTFSFTSEKVFNQCRKAHTGDLFMALTGENKQDIALAAQYIGAEEVAVGGDLCHFTILRAYALYFVYLINSPYFCGQKQFLATGDIIVHISADKLGSIPIPLPPLAEQRRIVAKIEELFAEIDKLK